MFWDRVAGVYDLFANVYNAKTHKRLKQVVADQISAADVVLDCCCGTGGFLLVTYEGTKEMLLVDSEDRDSIEELGEAMYDEFPAPKKKG